MSDQPRTYQSPLRERQTRQTRLDILRALTEIVAESGPIELSMQEVADRAGVAKRTLYRHFADRAAMVDALTDELTNQIGSDFESGIESVDDLPDLAAEFFGHSEAALTEARALVLLDADPRARAGDTRRRFEQWREVTARSLPELTDRQHHQLTALLRLLGSSHSWLRLHDEFDIKGTEASELIRFAMEALLTHTREGHLPTVDPEH